MLPNAQGLVCRINLQFGFAELIAFHFKAPDLPAGLLAGVIHWLPDIIFRRKCLKRIGHSAIEWLDSIVAGKGSPMHRIIDHFQHVLVVIDGISLVAGPKMEIYCPCRGARQQPLRKTSPPSNQLMKTSSSGSGISKCSPYISVCGSSKILARDRRRLGAWD